MMNSKPKRKMNQSKVWLAVLIVAAALTVYGSVQAAKVSHKGSEIEPPIDATALIDASSGLRLSAADILSRAGSVVTGPALPSCGLANRGQEFLVHGAAGAADTLHVCQKKADDTYGWVASGTGRLPGEMVAYGYANLRDSSAYCKTYDRGSCVSFSNTYWGDYEGRKSEYDPRGVLTFVETSSRTCYDLGYTDPRCASENKAIIVGRKYEFQCASPLVIQHDAPLVDCSVIDTSCVKASCVWPS